jgi:hypothetical protein
MPVNLKRLPYTSIFTDSLEGFSQQLATLLLRSKPLNVVHVFGDNQLQAMMTKESRNRIDFPFFAFRLSNMILTPPGYNPFVMRMFGVNFKNQVSSGLPEEIDHPVLNLKMIPVQITLTVNFIGLDVADMYQFVQRWMDAYLLHFLNFKLGVNKDQDISIRVDADPNITFPDIDTQADTGPMFMVEVTATMNTYMGTGQSIPRIKRFVVNIFDVETQADNTVDSTIMLHKEFDIDQTGHLQLEGEDIDL